MPNLPIISERIPRNALTFQEFVLSLAMVFKVKDKEMIDYFYHQVIPHKESFK